MKARVAENGWNVICGRNPRFIVIRLKSVLRLQEASAVQRRLQMRIACYLQKSSALSFQGVAVSTCDYFVQRQEVPSSLQQCGWNPFWPHPFFETYSL